MPGHLIFGSRQDYHSAAVQWALQEMGERAQIWEGIGPDIGGRFAVTASNSPRLRLAEAGHERLRSVWFRRPAPHKSIPQVSGAMREFVVQETIAAHRGLGAIAREMSDFSVGSELPEYPDIKLYQLKVAEKMGFLVPPTLVTNDREAAQEFVREHKRVALKPFNVFTWWEPDGKACRIASTSVIERGSFTPAAEALESCPCIFQKYLEKKRELRITVVGEHLFAASIARREGEYVDWRYAIGCEDFVTSAWDVGPELRRRVMAYMEALGLNFGCLDLVIDPKGNVWFLEINPAGQFLFIEEWIPEFSLLAAFAAMMVAGSPRFELPRGCRPTVDAFNRTRAGQAIGC